MKAVCWTGVNELSVDQVPDPQLPNAQDALVKVKLSSVCGSDLHLLGGYIPFMRSGDVMGHEFLGIVEDTGSEVAGFSRGDLVVAPFVWSDGTCDFCAEGLQTSCRHGGQWGHDLDGGQGEAVRVPQAHGTLVKLPRRMA